MVMSNENVKPIQKREDPEAKWKRLLEGHQDGETWQKFNAYMGGRNGKKWQASEAQIFAYLFTELDDLREDFRAILSRMNAIDTLITEAVKLKKAQAQNAGNGTEKA